MPETEPQLRLIRFGDFEVDPRSGELRKAGVRQKFGGQPFQVLNILLVRPGEVVTREELQKRLWPDTFVDFDRNLNTAINKIREVLGDSAESPRFVETLPRRGYRFIAPVNGEVTSSDQLAEQVSPALPIKSRRRALHYGAAILGIVVVVVGLSALWKTVFRSSGAPRVLRFRQLTNDGHPKVGPMATDGLRIYFNEPLPGAGSLIVQAAVKGGEAIPLSVPIKQPSVWDISKDGTELLVASGQVGESSSLWIQPVSGGSPRRVGTVLGQDAAFGVDGTSILYGTEHDVYSVSRDGSSSRKLFTVDGTPRALRFSPDANALRFTEFDYLHDGMDIMEASPKGTGLQKLLEGRYGEWSADGRFFIFENWLDGKLDLWALPDGKGFHWQKRFEKPAQLTSGPLDFQYPLPSKDGKEIYAIGSSRRAEVERYDSRSGEFIPFLGGISAQGVAFSPDGQWVAYTSYPDGMLWRSKADGSERLQLTFPPLEAFLPRWSPDGKQIAFNGHLPAQNWNIYLMPSEGGTPQHLLPSTRGQMDANWSPDGRSLVFATDEVPKVSISIIDLGTRQVSTLPGSSGLFSPHWSPDGRFIAAITAAADTLMIFDFASQKWTEGFGSMMAFESWSHDGKYLYFETFPAKGNCPIIRLRMSDRKTEQIADSRKIWRVSGMSEGCGWVGLGPDDSPMVARDIGAQEIYALEMEWP